MLDKWNTESLHESETPSKAERGGIKVRNCHPTLENGKLERSLLSSTEALPSPVSLAIVSSCKKQSPRYGESYELPEVEKVTIPYLS